MAPGRGVRLGACESAGVEGCDFDTSLIFGGPWDGVAGVGDMDCWKEEFGVMEEPPAVIFRLGNLLGPSGFCGASILWVVLVLAVYKLSSERRKASW